MKQRMTVGPTMVINASQPRKKAEGHTIETVGAAPPCILAKTAIETEVAAWYAQHAKLQVNEAQGQVVCFPAPPCILAPVMET